MSNSTEVWVALWHHKHGEDVAVFSYEPTESDVVKFFDELGGEYEPDRDESIEIRGPIPLIK